MRQDIQHLPKLHEVAAPDGTVTRWREVAILCLTPCQLVAIRGESMTLTNVSRRLTKARQYLRADGWQFVPNPRYHITPDGSSRPFLRAVPPPGQEPEVARAETI